TGDRITINAEKNLISVDLSDQELANRKQSWKMPAYKSSRGTLAKYIRLVKNASYGCVTDE
ncbi:MAG TPA: dihydroxy-acid dehydratase, partial [Terriglobia bacterium]|nr:dihydroxy-acid dehydratase [Terriglobia bacterium]